MFITIKIDPSFLGQPGDTNAISYRRKPYCLDCAMTQMTLDIFRMFDPDDQEEAHLFEPIAQSYVEATLQRTVVLPGTKCCQCRIVLGPDPRQN